MMPAKAYKLHLCLNVFCICLIALLGAVIPAKAYADFENYDIAVLQSLDKITARTATFEARVGATLSYGQVFMKVMTCKKRPPIERPEAAAFLKVWEVEAGKSAQWIFSGWMFASSPSLSAMDHPIYDVWLLDCKKSPEQEAADLAAEEAEEAALKASEDAVSQEPEVIEEKEPVEEAVDSEALSAPSSDELDN